MKLTTRSRYGTRLMLDMAERYNQGPIQMGEIAERQNISLKYLEQLIIPLKKAGYVQSIRGPRGGHMLTVDPEDIKLGEIVQLYEGDMGLSHCVADPAACDRYGMCALRKVWSEITEEIHGKLNAITFGDLVNGKGL